MQKNLGEWASIAEIIASIAVVVSVFFIVFELRSNTNAIQAQTYQAITSQMNEWRLLNHESSLAGVPSFRETNVAQASLQDIQRWRNNRLILWANYESAFFARQRGILGDEEWVRFDIAFCRAWERDNWIWNWTGSEQFQWSPTPFTELLTPSFVDYVMENCASE